jgi:integrase
MGYAQRVKSPKGDYYTGRYLGPDGKYLQVRDDNGGVVRYKRKRDAQKAAADKEADVRGGRHKDPRAADPGDILFQEWASHWYAGLALATSTMANTKRHLQQHLIPYFGARRLNEIDQALIGQWKDAEQAAGASPNSIRTWHGTLHTCLEDAKEAGKIGANPATARRGRGKRTGAGRRSSMQQERVITSPLGILLIAERMAILAGRDAELVMVAAGYELALRFGELVGLEVPSIRAGRLNPRNALRKVAGELRDEAVRVEWQLVEVEGTLYREPPKDASVGDVDLSPFMSALIEEHAGRTAPQACPCHGTVHLFGGAQAARRPRGTVPARAIARLAGVSDTTVAAMLYGKSGTRVPATAGDSAREEVLRAARALGWEPVEVTDEPAWHWRKSSFEGLFAAAASGMLPAREGRPRRPVPLEGEWPGTRVRGRNAAARAALAWEPVAEGMTPHGWRHALKARMEEARIPEVASEARLRHEIPGVSGAYRHVTEDMRAQLVGMLEADWAAAVDGRLEMSHASPVPVLDRLLKARLEERKPRLLTRNSQNTPEAVLPLPGRTASDGR